MDISLWLSAVNKIDGKLTPQQNQIACAIARRAQGLSSSDTTVREIRIALAEAARRLR